MIAGWVRSTMTLHPFHVGEVFDERFGEWDGADVGLGHGSMTTCSPSTQILVALTVRARRGQSVS